MKNGYMMTRTKKKQQNSHVIPIKSIFLCLSVVGILMISNPVSAVCAKFGPNNNNICASRCEAYRASLFVSGQDYPSIFIGRWLYKIISNNTFVDYFTWPGANTNIIGYSLPHTPCPNYDPALNAGEPLGSCSVGNPINHAVGNKYVKETDYVNAKQAFFRFSRYYNSMKVTVEDSPWRHSFNRSLTPLTISNRIECICFPARRQNS
jgi:hypothetical protein